MQIDWSQFTPGPALAGGVLIGLAAVGLALLVGRIAGISGILAGLLRPARADIGWRIAFLAGLAASARLYGLLAAQPAIRVDASTATLVVGGLLVGLGTRYGGGCTSGHGICGISRLSLRSALATLVFMASGIATVFLVRHVFP